MNFNDDERILENAHTPLPTHVTTAATAYVMAAGAGDLLDMLGLA